jgi:hypothetical protein
MQFLKDAFAQLFGNKLQARYQFAKQFTDNLQAAETVYANDPGKLAIFKSDYLAFLDAFEALLSHIDPIPGEFDTDFRRNLPGGGSAGLKVAETLKERIAQARQYVQSNEATAVAGQCILQNIDACLCLLPSNANVDQPLQNIDPIVTRVATGVIR